MAAWTAIGAYSLLTVVWAAVLGVYLRTHRLAATDRVLAALVAVLALDAAKNVLENVYFGLLWGSRYGVLGPGLDAVLGLPLPLTLVKLVNVAVGLTVLVRLGGQWLPAELERRARHRADEERMRRELEANLRAAVEAEEQLRIAVAASSRYLWDNDLRDRTMRFPDDVRAWLGYPPTAWPPRPWFTIVHPEDRARVLDGVSAAVEGRTSSYDVRHRVVTYDRRILHVHATGVIARDAQGTPVRFLGAVRDITREVEDEAHREQAQKLEGLGLLAGGVAHDFNNLLTALSSSLGVAEKQAPSEALATARLAVDRAALLTHQLLAYTGRTPSAPRPVNLGAAVAAVGRLLALGVPPGVRLVVELTDDLPPVIGDEGQLQQLVMNLVTNAAEAVAGKAGTVRVTAQVLDEAPAGVDAGGRPGAGPVPGPVVCVRVTDDGVGMAPEVAARIFDPLFSTKGPGRGLGLAALRGILQSHRGGVTVESAPGVGTTFSVYLPAAPRPSRPAPVAEPAEASPASRRVLLVDDDPMVRRSTGRLLASLGCVVTEVSSGAEAVAVAAEQPFDVAVLDLTMEGMDGVETARRLRAAHPALKLVLSSGYGGGHAERGLFDAILPKPYTPDQLARALRPRPAPPPDPSHAG